MGATASRRSPFPNPKERTPAILVVEDEVLIRLAISSYLQECGFHVYGASNSLEAIQILKATHTPIDLVFSDVAMPGEIDGFGLAQWIRTHRPGLPVILTSGDAKKSAAARELCENEPFLAKPYDLEQVVAKIRQAMNVTKDSDKER
jgi:CheY-like chemotaxis protein